MRFFLLFGLVFSLLFGMIFPVWAIKPRPPLQLSLHQESIASGRSRVTLRAVANIDIVRAELSFSILPPMTLIQGPHEWKGPLAKGEATEIEIVLQHPPGQKVTGKAMVHLSEGQTFTQQAELILGESKTEPLPSPPSARHKTGGEEILEFRGK